MSTPCRINAVDPVTGAVTGTEPFADHNADVTLVNMQFPTATATDRVFDIRIIGLQRDVQPQPGRVPLRHVVVHR